MDKVKKQYGLWTGVEMVIGIIIGSGVFLKAGGVLELTGGDLKLSILAWLVGGIIMVSSGFCFAVFATMVTKFNGVVDYVESVTNEKVGYGLAWLFTTFYYPIICAIVSLFAGHYFFRLFGLDIALNEWQNFLFAFILLTILASVNYLSPKIAARFQVSSTIIKIIPILIIGIVGIFASLIIGPEVGIVNGFIKPAEGYTINFGEAVKKTAFAFEGWVCATAINAEIKDSKKNLPKALIGGTIAVLLFYIIYYIGLSACLGNDQTIALGANAPLVAFEKIMGKFGGILFTVLIMISCIGTVNGVNMSASRGMYTMSCRGQGICPEKFSKLGKNQSSSFLSCLYGYLCILFMLFIWYLALNDVWIFGRLATMDEIVCSVVYTLYIFLYVNIIKKFEGLGIFKRYIMPVFAIIGSIFFILCGTGLFQLITTGSFESLLNFGVFVALMIILMIPSLFFYHKENQIEFNN